MQKCRINLKAHFLETGFMKSFKNLTSSTAEFRIPVTASEPIGVPPVAIAVVVAIAAIVSASPTKARVRTAASACAEAVAARRTVEVFAVRAIVVTRLKN